LQIDNGIKLDIGIEKCHQEEILQTSRRCDCGSGCPDCLGSPTCGCPECRSSGSKWPARKKICRGEVKWAEQNVFVWEEANAISNLFDMFIDHKLLNVVFDWSESRDKSQAEVTKAQLCFREVTVKGSKEVWSITEEVQPLDVKVCSRDKCRVVRQEKRGSLQKATAVHPPRIQLNLSLSFAFQDEVESCLEVVAEIGKVTRVRVGGGKEESSSNRRIRVTKTEIREECNVRMRSVKSPKYYCRSCEVDICKKCLQSWCNAHSVQWIGNHTFNCASPNHRFGSCF